MKVHLLFTDHDLEAEPTLPAQADDLIDDLQLAPVLDAMATGDRFLHDVARQVLLQPVTDLHQLTHRQDILRDCLQEPDAVRELYDLAVATLTDDRPRFLRWGRTPSSIVSGAIRLLEFHLEMLHQLRDWAERHAPDLASAGWTTLCRTLQEDLAPAYLDTVDDYLRRLRLGDGVTFGARLGRGLKPAGLVLHEPGARVSWVTQLLPRSRKGLSFAIAPRDEAGARALGELRDRGLEATADAVGQAAEHVRSFVTVLRRELAFYIGCLNLHDRLAAHDAPVCIPQLSDGQVTFTARQLYDPALRLQTDGSVVGNDLDADHTRLIVITGANQGGKSTFLRSLGAAQLMAQCGMFAPAREMRADVHDQLFTHFNREEDARMQQGKLDEELARLGQITEQISPDSMLLLNESLASTNEREGSQIAYGIVRALVDRGVKIVYVTHLFELAQNLHDDSVDTDLFLRAERKPDGERTHRIHPGEPQPTSHGQDVYRAVIEQRDTETPGTEPPPSRAEAENERPCG
ncbi:MAG: DNA mismatch repair protein MutS [Nitriliruptor sp.]|nr:MAG: DNA mismatch repair protein MutS [Nitriliruptor sp.]